MHYPAGQFDIHVVADHCKDETAQIATASGAICHERNEEPRGRKAYALQWLLERIIASEKAYDAIIVFDADSHVDPDFLLHMDQALSSGRPVWQGKHVILDPKKSHYSGLADVDMRINNLLRNQARERLGLSCRLMGDAMCFSTAVIREYGWPAESLGEDREYGLYLLTQGIRIGFAPDAISSGQAAPGWKDATSQRVRWYGGVFQIQKEFGTRLLHLWLRKGNWAAFDQALELWLPPDFHSVHAIRRPGR